MGRWAVVGSRKQLPRRRAQSRAANCPLASMGATGTKLDRKPAVAAQALASVRQLLVELGSARGMEELVACVCRTAWWRKRIRCRIWWTRFCASRPVATAEIALRVHTARLQ